MDNNDRLILLAPWVLDSEAGKLHPDTAVFIRNGIIAEVKANFSHANLPAEGRFRLIELSEHTLLPALIDCHVHLALDGQDFQSAQARWDNELEWLAQVRESLQNSLEHGLGLLRDGGDGGNVGLKVRNLVRDGELAGPEILACGQAVYKKGRYGSFLGPGASDLNEAGGMIETLGRQGVDWIKILVSGIVSFKEYGKVGACQFTQAELNYLVQQAHSLGLPVMAHASSDEAVVLTVNAGVDSVEHGYFLSTDSLKRLAAKNIPWIPTVVPVANQVDAAAKSAHSEESREIIIRTYELQLARIKEAFELGVAVGIGTDAGASAVPHGQNHYQELRLFAQAGLTRAEILKACTSTAARICGREQDFGAIRTNRKARLIGVRGNPLEDLSTLEKIEFSL